MMVLKYKIISIASNDIDKLKETFKKNNIDFELYVDEIENTT